ncbi:MAG: NAD(P)-dependent oxidoreductase [Elusimicrobia bacterium]|nr:NAD(P)-dependent oxidoreductase [Elusimicrobiota bacterium]
MEKIIITGADGFIGKKLIEFLKGKCEVIIFDKTYGKDILQKNHFKGIEGNYVIHLAGLTKSASENEFFKVNVEGTLNVLEFCRKNKAKFIFPSSAAVYGNAKNKISENQPANPGTFYGVTKLMCENLCRFYNNKYQIPTIILRIFNAYGPGQKPGLLIPDIICQLDNDKIVLGNSFPKRDFVYVDDIAGAIVKSLNLDGFEIINIGTGEYYSVKEIAGMITDRDIEYSDKRVIEDCVYADISKAKKILNWVPEISLKEGIGRILESRTSS